MHYSIVFILWWSSSAVSMNIPAVYKGTCGWRSCPQSWFCFGPVWFERQVFRPVLSLPPGPPGPPRPPAERARLRNEPACEPETHTYMWHTMYTSPDTHINGDRLSISWNIKHTDTYSWACQVERNTFLMVCMSTHLVNTCYPTLCMSEVPCKW